MSKSRKLFISDPALCICFFVLLTGQLAYAQQQAQFENLLNKVDTPSSWSNTPVSGIPTTQTQNAPSIITPQINQTPYFNQPGNNLFTRQQLLRMFLGGSPQSNLPTGSKNNAGSDNAYSDYQEAENQASRAHNAEERARYEKDKGNRESAASEAYYAANSAREASDRIYQASSNGDATAKQYVDQARAAADRAQGDCDRARYDADN